MAKKSGLQNRYVYAHGRVINLNAGEINKIRYIK